MDYWLTGFWARYGIRRYLVRRSVPRSSNTALNWASRTKAGMGTKLIVTLICNLIAVLILARVIHQLHRMDLLRGLKIAAGIGIGFCATALTMTYVWQSPPRRLWAIDTGYHIVGCLIMGAILSVWG